MKARMRSSKSSTDVKLPRFSTRRTKMLNQKAIWFSQLVCFGVYRNPMRWLTALKNAARVGIDCNIPLFSFSPKSSVDATGLGDQPHERLASWVLS